MRLKFFPGKQKEMLLFLKKHNSWKELSKLLGFSDAYLRNDLLKERRLLDQKTYRKICSILNKNFDDFIIEKLKDNWGQSKGGKISKGKTKLIKIPEDSVKLAEFFGIMLGDGNSHRTSFYNSRNDKRGTYSIKIVGDSRHDKNYLSNYVKPLIEELFLVKVRMGKFKPKKFKESDSKNAMFIEVNSVRLVDYLEKKGMKPGNKIKNNLGIPYWIKQDSKFLGACLRGLYDTDGGAYKLNNQNTYQIVFTNFNLNLLNDVKESLSRLGISASKITKGNKIYITKKSELRKFLKQIGFCNSRHLNKVKNWNL